MSNPQEQDDLVDCIALDLVPMCFPQFHSILLKQSCSIELSLIDYIQQNTVLATKLIQEPWKYIPLFEKACLKAQDVVYNEVGNQEELEKRDIIHLRIINPPAIKELMRNQVPTCLDIGSLIFFRGQVIRQGIIKIVDTTREYSCNKCGNIKLIHYDREQYNVFPKPVKCEIGGCNSTKFTEMTGMLHGIDYQEIAVQEQVNKLQIGTIPRSIHVILENDLVDTCKPGDELLITAIVMQRWKPLFDQKRGDIQICLYANNIHVYNQFSTVQLSEESIQGFKNHWKAHPRFTARNLIVAAYCPHITGMFLVKLCCLLVMIGGVQKESQGIRIRGDSHLLLVGDPGTGKSQFLKYCSLISPRSVFTTGIGSTSAGLTCTAVKDSGEWQLEAGALVLADRGVCCIDEFSSIREHDKTAIHEAMEQQSISVAKAGLVCKLHTRCSILAATNPKGKFDPMLGIEVNTALASPLLSRFDLILVLLDRHDPEWDTQVAEHILNQESMSNQPFFDLKEMQQYILYCKTFQPQLTQDTNIILQTYYQFQRNTDGRNQSRTTIRLLESLIRLAQAHAKLCCRDHTSIQDAIVAVLLLEASMQSAFLGADVGLHKEAPLNPDEDYFKQEKLILERLGLKHLLDDLPIQEETVNSPSTPDSRNVAISSTIQKHNTTEVTRLSNELNSSFFPESWNVNDANIPDSAITSEVSWEATDPGNKETADSVSPCVASGGTATPKKSQAVIHSIPIIDPDEDPFQSDDDIDVGLLGKSYSIMSQSAPNKDSELKNRQEFQEHDDLFGDESQTSIATPFSSRFGLSSFVYKK